MDAATKAGLLALLEHAVDQGWTVRAACASLELADRRPWRWLERRAADQLEDLRPGGGAVHGLLAEEVAEILELFHPWARSTAPIASSPTVLLPGQDLGVAVQRPAGP